MSESMIAVFQKINKQRQDEGAQIKPLTMFAEAWDYQQKKIDAVLKYLDGCECSLDVDIDSIQELLK